MLFLHFLVVRKMIPRRRKGWPFGWDDEFDNIFESMEEMMRDLMERAEKGEIKQSGPFVYGFSMRVGPDGKIIVDEFGNKGKEGEISDEREPVTDIINDKKEVVVICELPGVNKEDIRLKVNEGSMNIKVDTAERKYNKTLKLPAKVDPKSTTANYKNGVLEVRLKKIGEQQESGYDVKIH